MAIPRHDHARFMDGHSQRTACYGCQLDVKGGRKKQPREEPSEGQQKNRRRNLGDSFFHLFASGGLLVVTNAYTD